MLRKAAKGPEGGAVMLWARKIVDHAVTLNLSPAPSFVESVCPEFTPYGGDISQRCSCSLI